MLIYSQFATGFNSVLYQFAHLLQTPNSRQTALGFVEHLRRLSDRLRKEFPETYQPAQQTLDHDIKTVSQKLAAKYP